MGIETSRLAFVHASWDDFAAWRLKCSTTTLWRLPGTTLRAGAEMLQNDPLETSWDHFAGWHLKCSKTTLWMLPGDALKV
jgi:hypothetical protein